MSLFSKSAIILAVFISFFGHAKQVVNLQLRWLHQFQFAGYYMAIEKGFYDKYGIQVNLIEESDNVSSPIKSVLQGDADFAISGSGVVISRMQGKPVVALAAISQTSPLVWISLAKSNINRPQDLLGKNLPIISQVESAELLAIFKKEGIDTSGLKMVESQFTVDDLIAGKIDALNAYASNEPYLLNRQNVKYQLMAPLDYGVNFYNDVLITSSELTEKSPKLVENFVKASLEGWQYAFSHIDEAVLLTHTRYAPDKSIEHLTFEAIKLKELAMPDLVSLGHMNPGRWQKIAQTYQELGMAQPGQNIDGLIYQPKKQDLSWLIHVTVITLFAIFILSVITWRFAYLASSLKREVNRRIFAEQKLIQLNNQLKQQATSDPLTQIYNRRAFFENGHAMLKLAQRKQLASCLFMLDLDHFKMINDKYGHHSGDLTLKAFVKVIKKEMIREHDVFARIGGEEFVILMMDCDLKSAHTVATRLLNCIRQIQVTTDNQDRISFTASIGVCQVQGELEACLNQADAALYQAKQNGRDRYQICSAQETQAN